MSTQAEFLANPALIRRRVVLAELRPRQILRGWSATAGRVNVYEIAWGPEWGPAHCRRRRTIEAVREGSTLLTEQASVADVEATPGSWYWDSANELLYMQGAGGDPDAGDMRPNVEWTARFATRADGPDYDGHAWDPRLDLARIPEFAVQGINHLAGATIPTTAGSLRLDNRDGLFNELLYSCGGLGGARLRLLLGSVDLPYSEFRAIFSGQVTKTARSDTELVCELRPMAAILNGSLPRRVFTEANYPGCREELLGDQIPLLFGPMEGIRPPLVRSKETDWRCRFNGTAYAGRSDGALNGLKIVGPVSMGGVMYLDNLDAQRPLLGRWGGAGAKSYTAVIQTSGLLQMTLSQDGSAAYIMQSPVGSVVARREIEWVAAYNTVTQLGVLRLDGMEQPLTLTGTPPTALYNATVSFLLGFFVGGSTKFLGWMRDVWVAAGFYQSRPSDPTAIVGSWLDTPGLIDTSGRANHLLQTGGIDETNLEDSAGGDPVRHMIRLNDGVENEMLSCATADLADNLQDGFVLQFRLAYRDGTTNYYFGGIADSADYQFACLIQDGQVRIYLSSDGTSSWAYIGGTTITLSAGERVRIKLIYDGSSATCKIYINDAESITTISGSVPASIFASSAPLRFGATTAATYYCAFDYEEIAISANHAGQINGDEITDVIHRWRLQPENIYTSGGTVYVADDFGGCPLTLSNCDASNLVYCEGGDKYVIADRLAQGVRSVERVYYTEGSREIELDEGTDYAWVEEDCELTVHNPAADKVYIDAQGVSCGEIYSGIAGRADTDLATRASDAILWLLQLAGAESSQVDLAAAAAARMGDKAVGFYLTSTTSITQLVQRLCLSGCLLDLVVDDQFRLYRWTPSIIGPTSIAGEEFEEFEQPADTSRLYGRILVGCAAGTAQADVVEAAELHGITAVKEISTYLLGLSDAQLLADRLALLAARPPLTVQGTVGNLRLYGLRPGDALLVTRAAANGPGGTLAAYPLVIERLRQLAAKGESGLEASDWRGAGPRTAKVVATGYPNYADCDVVQRHRGGFVDNGVASAAEGQRVF